MTPDLMESVMDAAFDLLPSKMNSHDARRFLFAIGFYESKMKFRRQLPKGPARGYWQFETGGVWDARNKRGVKSHARRILKALDYDPTLTDGKVKLLLEHNDVLAVCFARLLMWTIPKRLPKTLEEELAYQQYLSAWRPRGRDRKRWARAWNYAVVVMGDAR